jgi:hypothetical protein
MNTEELVKETERYLLRYGFNERKGRHEFVVSSLLGAGHRATFTTYTLLSDDDEPQTNQPLTREVAQFIIDNFEKRGDTESFNIYASDLKAGKLLPRQKRTLTAGDIRHKLGRAENSYTATGAKLAYHWPIFEKFKETGFASIIRATMTNHQVCSSRCPFCSTISRNKRDSISLQEAKDFVSKLYFDQAELNRTKFAEYNAAYKAITGSDIRLRGLILSGGGQPNLWPHMPEFVEWLSKLDIDLGLITNGFPRNVPEEIYRRFRWIRVSITPEDASPFYPEGKFNLQYMPSTVVNNPDVTVGYSYVYGPWTTDDVLGRIVKAIEDNGFDYCRMLTDCNLPRDAQLRAHDALSTRLIRLGIMDADGRPLKKIFHQLKYHGTPEQAADLWSEGQCYLQVYNAFWDTTGHEENGYSYCYPCDSVTVLAEESSNGQVSTSERKFDPSKWGTVKNTEVERLFTEKVHPFFDPRHLCTSCLFMRNNETVKKLVADPRQAEGQFDGSLAHVNFP